MPYKTKKQHITSGKILRLSCCGFFLISILIFNTSCSSNKGKNTIIDFQAKWDTLKVLENPHKGWYHHYFDNGIHRYIIEDEEMLQVFPGMDHIYLRLAWAFLEPEEGRFNWAVIDTVIDKFVRMGYRISFRISCKETGGSPGSVPKEINGVRYATPYWVKLAGAKGVVPDPPATPSWTPDWDDPVYLEKLDNFHKAFAERYDSNPSIIYIDIGSIGDWGEGHTNPSTKIPPNPAEVRANIDIYLKNYKQTQLVTTHAVLSWGKSEDDSKVLYNYAIDNNITLRNDSPMVEWFMKKNLDTWTITKPHYYDPLYLKKPIIHELQHYAAVKRDGNWLGKNGKDVIPAYGFTGAEIYRNSIKIMHATYIGYHGYLEEFYNDNPDLAGEFLNLCGYWYFPVSASYKPRMSYGNNTISFNWLNKGVAPAYKPYSIMLSFEGDGTDDSFKLIVLETGNMKWLPGKVNQEKYSFEIPSDIHKGKYILKFKMVDLSSENYQNIFLGLKDEIIDNENFISIGKVRVI